MVSAAHEKVHSLENDRSSIFRIKTYNKISSKGLSLFPLDHFEISSDLLHPHAYILRSQHIWDDPLPGTVMAIGRAGAGVNNIPVELCTEKGIVVFNTPGANANAVKELVIAGMLLAARDIVGGINYVNSIAADPDMVALVEANKSRFKGYELAGKRLGVIGLGAIGIQVANAGLSLGMSVKGYDPFISVDAAWELSRDVERSNSLEHLMRTSDFISVHVPYNDKTRGFIHADRIQMMAKGAVLLNFSRHELVDESAMITALQQNAIRSYVSDFPNPRLAGVPNVISIPHLGASTAEAEDNCAIMVSKNVRDFLISGAIRHSVNFPSIYMDRSAPFRIAVVNKNVPKVIGKITSVIADAGANIAEMANKSRDNIAYTIIDLETPVSDDTLGALVNLDDVVRVRRLPTIEG
jgi:D-3-phosphoglycerate dehydrogenase